MDAGGCGGWRLEVPLEHERRAQRRLAFADSVRVRVWTGLGLGLGLADLKANFEPFRRGSSGLVSGLGVARASQCWQAARRHERPKSRAPAAWAG